MCSVLINRQVMDAFTCGILSGEFYEQFGKVRGVRHGLESRTTS